MRFTILIDDKKSTNKELVSEHGLSIYIEKNGTNILFDTGQSGLFAENAQKMGIDLSDVDLVIISHGHYDHGGGLETFFRKNKTAPIILRENTEIRRYSKRSEEEYREIGLNETILKEYSSRIKIISENSEILSDIIVLTDIKNKYSPPRTNNNLFEEINGRLRPDLFQHELILVILEKEGIYIITGCSHNGILNMIETAMELYPEKIIKAVFGGFHLINQNNNKEMDISLSEVEYIGKKLLEYPIEMIYTGHCTGDPVYSILKNILGEKLDYWSTGSIIEY